MASGMHQITARKVIDHITGKTTFTLPTVWLALFTTTPSDTTAGTEATGGSYARKSTAATDWNAASGGGPASTTNATLLTFVTPTGSWGTINGFALMDAVTAGNILVWGDLTTPQAVGTGNTVSFAIGAITISQA